MVTGRALGLGGCLLGSLAAIGCGAVAAPPMATEEVTASVAITFTDPLVVDRPTTGSATARITVGEPEVARVLATIPQLQVGRSANGEVLITGVSDQGEVYLRLNAEGLVLTWGIRASEE